MRILRLDRVAAIARRDLAMELRGARGWVLPAVMAGLLAPAAAIPLPLPTATPPATRGDVPPAVAAIAPISPAARTVLRRDAAGRLAVEGPIPRVVRDALDAGEPAVALVSRSRSFPIPRRTALLALIASSTLTGAIASAIPGERAARTLSALLSASVSRLEIAVGKWAAWGGLGAAASLLAAAVALAAGSAAPGPWLLALPCVPLGTVAFGLWLVRSAGDALTGSTTSIRVVPAVVGGAALAAWGVGLWSPALGAAIPIGGAVLAAGATWGPGWAAPVIACASTALASAGWLAATARDLDERPVPRPWSPLAAVAAAAALGAATSWAALFPWLWHAAGNPAYSRQIPESAAVWSAAALGAWAAAVGLARLPAPSAAARSRALWIAPLALALALGGAAPDPSLPGRLGALLTPAPGLAALALAVADELLYRNVLRRWLGTSGAALAWTLARAPFDPLQGLASGLGLGWLATWRWEAAVAARLGWIALAAALPVVPGAWVVSAATIAALAVTMRRTPSPSANPAA